MGERNILVTGGAGFIGSNYIKHVLQNTVKIKIVNLDLLTYAGSLENLTGLNDFNGYEFVKGSITEANLLTSLFEQYKFDAVINFAAESHVDRSILGPKEFIHTNILGTFELLEASRKYLDNSSSKIDKFRFHHISTDEVYGTLSPTDPAFSETTPYAPTSPYSASKASSDHLVRAYFYTFGIPILITNCSNNYGPFQFPEKLIPLIILNALEEKPLPIYGDGQQIRDWLFVEDHCEALLKVLETGEIGETYNIGGDNQTSNLEIVDTICQHLDSITPRKNGKKYSELIKFVKDRPGHDRRYDVNIDKISKELNWTPKENLISGLEKTIMWYLENLSWVSKVSDNPDYKGWVGKNYNERGKYK